MPYRTKSKKQREREEELARQTRLAYVGTLAGGLAHEIRSPLQAVKLNIGLLRELAPRVDDEVREKYLNRIDRIQREIEWLNRLVSEFLSFARPPKPARLPTDLNELVCEVAETVREFYLERYEIQLETECDPELFPVLLDKSQFTHGVVMNLLENAREAIGSHGSIILRTHGDHSWVYLEVRDNGPGIPEKYRERILEVFFSTKEHGTGLGLGIASRLCQEFGGDLALKDTGPQGTTFELRLPKARILTYEEGGASEHEAGKEN